MRQISAKVGLSPWQKSPLPPAAAQEIPAGLLDAYEWRELGPAVFGGRITDVALPDGQSQWVLIWDRDFAALTPEERARLEVLKTSEGTDPKGKRHMMLAKLRPRDQEPSG